MKRVRKEKHEKQPWWNPPWNPIALEHFPLFWWTKCNGCREEFIWEKMWLVESVYIGKRYKGYFCKSCAPTEEDAKRLLTKPSGDNGWDRQ